MENSYLNASELWNVVNRDLAVFTKTASKRYLPPIAMLPALRLKLLLHLQNCLIQWEEIDRRVHPNAPADKKWVFDRIGNILRSALLQLRNSKITSGDLYKLSIELNFAQELSSQVDKEFFWYTTVMTIPGSLYSLPNSDIHPKKYPSSQRLKRNHQSPNLFGAKEEGMSDYIPKLRKTLETYRDNAVDLQEYMARDPYEPSLRRKFEDQVDHYHKIARQLQAKGEKVDDSFFDDVLENNNNQSKIKRKLVKTQSSTIRVSKLPTSDANKNSSEEVQAAIPNRENVDAIQNTLIEYLGLFKKDFTIDAHEPLKIATESRFEILLFRVNNIIDEIERIGEDAYYLLEVAKMLDMSICRLRQQEVVGKSKDVSSFLKVAIEMLNK